LAVIEQLQMLNLFTCRCSSLFRETPRNLALASTHENYFSANWGWKNSIRVIRLKFTTFP